MSSLQSRILIGIIGFPSVIYVILNHIYIFNIIVVFCFVLAFKEFVKIINTFNNRTYWFFFWHSLHFWKYGSFNLFKKC